MKKKMRKSIRGEKRWGGGGGGEVRVEGEEEAQKEIN